MSYGRERRCELACPGPVRDRLVEALLNGEKTATCSLLTEWREENEELPRVGERQMVVDSGGNAVAVIEIVGLETIRLGDASLDLALAEGEGFRSVEDWRAAHEAFWRGDDTEGRGGGPWRLDDDTEVVVERFRLLTRLPP